MGNSYTSKGERTPFDFELDGVPFVCAGGIDILDLSELAKLAEADTDSPEGVAAVADTFKAALGPDEWLRFRKHTRAKHTDNDTLFEILRDMVQYATAGPTKPPSPSLPGRPNTNGGSPDISWPGLAQQPLTDDQIEQIRAKLAGKG